MTRSAAVRVDDDLASGQAGVAHRPADHELAGRVHVDEVAILVEALLVVDARVEHGMQHLLDHVLLDRLGVGGLGVLRRDEDALDLDRRLPPVLVDARSGS